MAVDVRAEVPGFVTKLHAQAGDTVEVGKPLLNIEAGEKPADAFADASSSPAPAPAPAAEPAPASKAPVPAPAPAPAASKQEAAPKPKQEAAPAPAPAAGARSETRVKMSRMRQRIAQRLKDAQNTAAMLTTFQEVDMSALMAMRKEHKEAFEKHHGVKLGFMSAFVKGCTAALQEIPAVNARIEGSDVIYHDFVDVSVAVASPRGLVVPVLRNTESMSFADVEKNLADLAQRAQQDKIALEEMTGGTFTISNGGVFGSLMGTPILNPPQSAILGMHTIKQRPVVVDGKIEIRPMMYLALTYDHRMVDGREAVTFLVSLRDKLQDPTRFLLEL